MIDFGMGNLQLIGILAASVSKGGYGPWNPHFKLEKLAWGRASPGPVLAVYWQGLVQGVAECLVGGVAGYGTRFGRVWHKV